MATPPLVSRNGWLPFQRLIAAGCVIMCVVATASVGRGQGTPSAGAGSSESSSSAGGSSTGNASGSSGASFSNTSTNQSPATFWQSSPLSVPSSNYSWGNPFTTGPSNFDPVFQLKELRRRWAFLHPHPYGAGVFFPLTPPALAQTAAEARPHFFAPGFPLEMLDYIGEPFYMAYGNLHFGRDLSSSRERRVTTYREARQRLVSELRRTIDESWNQPAAERAATLTALAERQAPALRDLELEAEAIRADLTGIHLISAMDDGGRLRDWIDDSAEGEEVVVNQFLAALLAAEYHAGLSIDQRELLHELAQELQASVGPADDRQQAEKRYVDFLPATSRIRLPADIPAGLRAQLDELRDGKTQLKRELQSAIARESRFLVSSQRTRSFQRLAEEQAPALARLAGLAEEIRTQLAAYPYPDEPAGTSLPGDLTRRVGELAARKIALRRAITGRLKDVRRQLPDYRIGLAGEAASFAISVTSQPAAARTAPRDVRFAGQGDADAILASLADFNRTTRQKIAELATETAAVRAEIERYATSQPRQAQTVQQWAAAFNRSYASQENWNRYRDYHRAVLVPGLSPEQRRLLYRAALQELARNEGRPVS